MKDRVRFSSRLLQMKQLKFKMISSRSCQHPIIFKHSILRCRSNKKFKSKSHKINSNTAKILSNSNQTRSKIYKKCNRTTSTQSLNWEVISSFHKEHKAHKVYRDRQSKRITKTMFNRWDKTSIKISNTSINQINR